MSYPYQIKDLAGYHEAYQKSIQTPDAFWGEVAENFTWQKKWDKVSAVSYTHLRAHETN
jgi:acetyl-CoA synthetase